MLRTTLTRNGPILLSTMRGVAVGAVRRRSEFRHHVVRDAWTVAKRFAAGSVVNIERREIPFLVDAVIEGYIEDHQVMLIAALAQGLGAKTFFEFGTNRGRTSWTVARNNPEITVYTLDLPLDQQSADTTFRLESCDECFRPGTACGEAFLDTPEAARITQLWGDSATFDYSPYEGSMDLIYIDGAHTYEYVKSDTANALAMLSPSGTIVWDDYAPHPGVYRLVTELAPSVDHPVYHVFGTRLALYGRQDFVVRQPFDDYASAPF